MTPKSRTRREPPIRTRRLVLRPLTDADAFRIGALAGDWDVARMTARIPYPYTSANAKHWIDDLVEGEVVRGIEHKGELIGLCGYVPAGKGAVEIGFWIGRPWWRQGFATEAVQALIGHCFGEAGVRRVICGHFVDNPASARVIAKLGFRFVGQDARWCEARRQEVEALHYERRRPFMARLGLRAA